jgi:hypothetical protein
LPTCGDPTSWGVHGSRPKPSAVECARTHLRSYALLLLAASCLLLLLPLRRLIQPRQQRSALADVVEQRRIWHGQLHVWRVERVLGIESSACDVQPRVLLPSSGRRLRLIWMIWLVGLLWRVWLRISHSSVMLVCFNPSMVSPSHPTHDDACRTAAAQYAVCTYCRTAASQMRRQHSQHSAQVPEVACVLAHDALLHSLTLSAH